MDFESYQTRRAAWLTANGFQARSGRNGISRAACRLTAAGRAVRRRAAAAQRAASAPASSPMAGFVRSRLVAAAGGRVALRTVWTLWEAETAASGGDSGSRAELAAALGMAFPAARLVRARSGVDVAPGRHIIGVALI